MSQIIRILSTSDVHGAVFPHSYADGSAVTGSFSRLKTLIDSLRDENTLVIDNGDTIEGTPLTFYHETMRHDSVCPATAAMRMIGYDAVNVGNHDFGYGPDALFLHLSECGAPCITANWQTERASHAVSQDSDAVRCGQQAAASRKRKSERAGFSRTPGAEGTSPWIIRSICGKKIALFGLTTRYIPHWFKAEELPGMHFAGAFETARRIVAALREQEHPDYIVCVYHGGFAYDPETGAPTEKDTGENEGYRLLTELPGIDVLITGHQHRVLCGTYRYPAAAAQNSAAAVPEKNTPPLPGKSVVYTQPGSDGAYLSCVEINTVSGEISARLVPVDTPPDPAVLAAVQEEEDACQRWLDEPLGTCAVNLTVPDEDDARVHKSQVITFLNMVQREATGAALSASALFRGATGFRRDISMRDLVSTYIYPNTLVVKRVTGEILRAYLERAACYFDVRDGQIRIAADHDEPVPQHYNYDMVDGVEYTIKVSNPRGSRVISLTRNGIPVSGADVFELVINNYRASGAGGFDMLRDAETLRENQNNMVDLIAQYILRHKTISFSPVHNIQVIP